MQIGFRYGSLVEDYYTGYRLQCEGWKSAFCNPSRAAFLGDIPITINDVLNQVKRWSVGLLEVAFSKYSPLTYGSRTMGILMGLGYAHYSLWPIWSIPITIYALVPSLALLQGLPIFAKVHLSITLQLIALHDLIHLMFICVFRFQSLGSCYMHFFSLDHTAKIASTSYQHTARPGDGGATRGCG